MAHHTAKDGYRRFADRLNQFPQGAPPTELLFQTLRVLVTEQEASWLSQVPIRPFDAKRASAAWKIPQPEARKRLEQLADKCLLLDVVNGDERLYMLPPPMAGFFEFSLMRLRDDVDQKLLSELFYQYVTVEEDFIRDLMVRDGTPVGRAFVNEAALPDDNTLHVLDYERASSVMRQASHIAVGMCYCRHKASHTVGACQAPMDICMTFGDTADALIRHGYARRVESAECLDLLDTAYAHNLVQFGENVQRQPSFICNCCGCCCEALMAARKFGLMHPVETTQYLPEVHQDSCTGCGRCVQVCPVEAMGLVSANDPARPNRKTARLDERICLGCAVCVRACPTQGALGLKRRKQQIITPVNSVHRIVLMAIERGKLQNLIFDNQAHLSHRAMAAILGVILRLPPVKQIMASNQMKSRYLVSLVNRVQPGDPG
jgi:formate hydrogenlyase subunit 6/NADH:ubiquinone oxidoreductase subunit I